MDELNLLLRYATRLLIWVAPVEFLCGRAISRAARQMPAGEVGATIFGAISSLGTFLVMPAFVLVAVVLVLAAVLALRGDRTGALARPGDPGAPWPRPLAGLLLLLVVFSVVLPTPDSPPPLLFAYNCVSAATILGIAGWFVWRARAGRAVRATVALFGLAYAGYYIYALSAILTQNADAPLGDFGVWANAAGEALGMAAGISLLWSAGPLGRPATAPSPRPLRIGLAALGAVVVLIAPLFEQWLQGVATQFSVGFTLFLPVPIQALALAAWIYAALAANSRAARTVPGLPWAWDFGAALLLLPAAGYALQLNYQHLLLAATLLLLTGLLRPLSSAAPVPDPAVSVPRRDAETQRIG